MCVQSPEVGSFNNVGEIHLKQRLSFEGVFEVCVQMQIGFTLAENGQH